MEQRAKKKILYIITKSNWGGAQRYVFDLATNLPKDRFEAVVASGGNGPLQEKLLSAGIRIIRLRAMERDMGLVREIPAFLEILKIMTREKPDILHLNSSKAGGLGAFAARLYNLAASFRLLASGVKSLILKSELKPNSLKLKAVFTAHGWAFKEKRHPFIRKIIEYVSWVTIALCHAVIVVSQDDKEKIAKFLFVNKKIRLIQNGLAVPNFEERTVARRLIEEKVGQPLGKSLWLGTVAELHKNKGLEYGISAVKQITSAGDEKRETGKIRYIIIGSGEQKTALEKFIKENGLESSVFLAGEIPNASSLLKAFDIFLIPSLKEGLPYVLLEAGLAELPVIGSNVGGIPEVIQDMESGIVVRAKRPKEIADALAFLITRPEKQQKFGERILERIKTEYTLERMVEETITLYEKIF